MHARNAVLTLAGSVLPCREVDFRGINHGTAALGGTDRLWVLQPTHGGEPLVLASVDSTAKGTGRGDKRAPWRSKFSGCVTSIGPAAPTR